MPTAAQLSLLPELACVRVPPDWQVLNGHIERVGLVDLEHHIWFQRELHVDDEIAVHLDTRRTVALAAVVRERIDALLHDHDALDWPAPRSGAISLQSDHPTPEESCSRT
jgi:hypothetical protein